MLKEASEIDELKKESVDVPYIDPEIEKNALSLAVRMAKGGMVRGVERAECVCGMFTVVKGVDGSGEDALVRLRLVFDQREPNKFWKDPPWTPLGGPGALAALDISDEERRAPGARIFTIKGDAPNCFY
eukprot:15159872-Alexandrium_andersonii.AAC.1